MWTSALPLTFYHPKPPPAQTNSALHAHLHLSVDQQQIKCSDRQAAASECNTPPAMTLQATREHCLIPLAMTLQATRESCLLPPAITL